MSMIGNFFMADSKTIQELQSGKASLYDMTDLESDEEDEETCIDIDKTWNAIHYILTEEIAEGRDAETLSKVIFSNCPVNDEDVGYGPAMLKTEEEVKAISQEIQAISREAFREHFSIAGMLENDVYPIMADEDEDSFFEYVWTYFVEVKDFYERAAKENKLVLFYIN